MAGAKIFAYEITARALMRQEKRSISSFLHAKSLLSSNFPAVCDKKIPRYNCNPHERDFVRATRAYIGEINICIYVYIFSSHIYKYVPMRVSSKY